MDYTQELNKILKDTEIWSDELKEISDGKINKIKCKMEDVGKVKLERMLSVIEDMKIEESETLNMYVGTTATIISIVTLILAAAEEFKIFVIVVYLLIIIFIGLYLIRYKIPRDRYKNNKIKCIEIAIREILAK